MWVSKGEKERWWLRLSSWGPSIRKQHWSQSISTRRQTKREHGRERCIGIGHHVADSNHMEVVLTSTPPESSLSLLFLVFYVPSPSLFSFFEQHASKYIYMYIYLNTYARFSIVSFIIFLFVFFFFWFLRYSLWGRCTECFRKKYYSVTSNVC